MADYSETPLLQKLGIKPGVRMALVHPPKGFKEELGSLPEGVKLVSSNNSSVDFILLFVSSESELQKRFLWSQQISP